MEEHNLFDIYVDLDMFSRLSANTSVHLDRNNHFIITAQRMSHIFGAQAIANYYKSHSDEKLIMDLDKFARRFITLLHQELDKSTSTGSAEFIRNIQFACREFRSAYNGMPDIIDGGLYGLYLTLKKNPMMASVLNYLIINIAQIESSINGPSEINLLDCPEANYTDEEWYQSLKVVPKMQKECIGFFEYHVKYSLILTLNQLETNPNINYWDEICQFSNGASIILGGLPIVGYPDRNDLKALIDLGISAVLAVVRVFENNSPGYVYSPHTPTEFTDSGIYYLQTPSPDFGEMTWKTILRGIAFIRWNVQNGRKIYVHCKSGKSRSFMVVVCYLIMDFNYTADDAIAYVKSCRPQAGFGINSKKMTLLREFESEILNNK